MPIRVLLESVTVMRGDKRVRLAPGQEFDFTDKEIAEIEGTAENPGVRPQAWKRKVVEVADAAKVSARAAPVAAKAAPVGAKAADPAPAPGTDGDGAGDGKQGAEAGL